MNENQPSPDDKPKAKPEPAKPRLRVVTALSDFNGRQTAACNDGTIWERAGGAWQPMPSIPQPE